MRLFSKYLRIIHIYEQSNDGSLRYVVNYITIRFIVHELVECLFHIVMLVLLAFRCVVGDLPCNIRQRCEANRVVLIH